VALAALLGLCAGALLIGALPRAAGAGVAPELLAQLPALTTPGMHFDQAELHAQVGQLVAMRLTNTHGAPHSFDIDELNVHVPAASGQEGLILFVPERAGTYTFYCNVPGHREAGMVGTLVVAP
jgi:plastocyanin